MAVPSPQKIDGRGRRVLVIDDDLAIRVLLDAVLRRLNFTVDLAEDGGVGLDLLRKNDYQLVLLDLMMPRVNGYEFLEQVRTNDNGARYPHIVVFTAAGQRGIAKIPPQSVCNSILKPFDLENFFEMIDDCLEGKHPTE